MIEDGRTLEADLRAEADLVVVGSGAGGAVLAREAAAGGLSVILLEEGGHHTKASFGGPPLGVFRKIYRDAGMTGSLGRPGIPIPLGRAIGGTTIVNSGTCFRTPPAVLRRWGVEPEEMAPHVDRVWDFLQVGPPPPGALGKTAEIIARGADKLGLSHGPLDRNAPGCKGSGVCCFGCPTGAKRSMDLSYIPSAWAAGARIVSHARVQRVLVEGGRAVGVTGVLGAAPGHGSRRSFEVRASSVALCCGSLITPTLLAKQDLGPRRHRGRHLTIHPAGKVLAFFDEPVRTWEGVPQGYAIDALADEGIMFEGASLPPEYGCVAMPWFGSRHTRALEAFDRIDMFGFLVSDRGLGRVRRGPGGRPLVTYTPGAEEVSKFVKATALLAEVYLAAGAKRLTTPIFGFDDITSAAGIDALRRARVRSGDLEIAAFHPLGTCRMAEKASDGVVDGDLKVHGVDGLLVVDGSIFPSSLGVNPQISIMAFATRAAEHLLRASGRSGLGAAPTL